MSRVSTFLSNRTIEVRISVFQPQLDAELVGRIIARFRTDKGLSQDVLSGLAGIGRTHLSAIETGKRKPTLETLYRISCALDTSMSAIVIAIEKELE